MVADLGGALEGGGRDTGPAEEVVKEIEAAGGEAIAVCGSVTDEREATAMVQAALDAWGRIDVVVNNAGIADPDWFEEMTLERVRRMIEVHFLGTANVCFAAWPHMIEAGYGRIVNTTSEAATGNVPKATAYGAGKGAVLSFTRELSLEARRHTDLHVNAVAPRANTRLSAPEIMAKTYDAPVELFTDMTSMAAFRPELVAPAVAYLAHESCTLQGDVLVAGAGQVMSFGFVQNTGITSDDLTPEDIAENIETILDLSGGTKVESVPPAGI